MAPCLDEPWRLPGQDISVAAAPLQAEWLWSRVFAPSRAITEHVRDCGLQIADIDHADSELFTKAAEAIASAPSLAAIVATRVAVVHLLRADPGYDVSHSEPRWRDRIFVSVPDRKDAVGTLRLAEGVIHEALHLHLTELEAISPLVRDLTGALASPWRLEPRSYGGVLHGTFVFVCLKAYFDTLAEPSGSPEGFHILARRTEIARELAELDLATLTTGLTHGGAALLQRLTCRNPRVGNRA